jgi:hypothetical protein
VKERLVSLGLAAGALALFWILMFPKPQSGATAPRPLTTGTDTEGYAVASRWLAAAGVSTLDLRQRLDHLGDRAISAQSSGNLLITTLPYETVAHPQELSALDAWVERGNTVLVLAALDDSPLWSAVTGTFIPQLQKMTAIEFTPKLQSDTDPIARARAGLRAVLTPAGRAVELRPSGRFGLLEGVRHLATSSPLPSTQWQAKAMNSSPVLELARRADTADPVLWLKANGNGAIIVSAYASLFNNGVIGHADNARLLSNVIAWALQPGGRVIFDDAHQGALDEYDSSKFFADPRLHHTLLWVVVLWLAWVVAAQPLRAAAPNAGAIDESAMLRVTAGFFASVLRPVTSAQWLLDEFFDRLRRRHGLTQTAGPPWDWLDSHAGIRTGLLDELRDLYSRTHAGERVSLVRLQRIISQISGQTS